MDRKKEKRGRRLGLSGFEIASQGVVLELSEELSPEHVSRKVSVLAWSGRVELEWRDLVE